MENEGVEILYDTVFCLLSSIGYILLYSERRGEYNAAVIARFCEL